MKIDLAQDQAKIRRYILQRVKDYPEYVNNGPGKDEAPIQLVTVGYYLEQTGYVAVVFDTRPDADTDGEWTGHLDEGTTMLLFPKWPKLIDDWASDKPSEMKIPSGKTVKVTAKSHTHEAIAKLFGEMLRDTMLALRDAGELAGLPLAKDAFLSVEEFDGHWGWPSTYEKRKQVKLHRDAKASPEPLDEETEEEREQALLDRVAKLSTEKQIAFWISELTRRAAGKKSEVDKVFLDTDLASWGNECAANALGRIGNKAVVPMLKLVRKLAKQPEWDGDRPKRNLRETPVHDVAITLIWKVRDLGIASNQVEQLLWDVVRISCQTNEERRLWGIIPRHTALCLGTLFPGYPEAKISDTTNRLLTPEAFQRRPDSKPRGGKKPRG